MESLITYFSKLQVTDYLSQIKEFTEDSDHEYKALYLSLKDKIKAAQDELGVAHRKIAGLLQENQQIRGEIKELRR